MPGFTIQNLKEVEDSAAERGPEIEARFARVGAGDPSKARRRRGSGRWAP